MKILICGIGAIGSHLALNLAKVNVLCDVLDFDKVELKNSYNQVFGQSDVGYNKTSALKNIIFKQVGKSGKAHNAKLISRNVNKYLKNYELIVDCFDNYDSRILIKNHKCNSLHVGMVDDYFSVMWKDDFNLKKVENQVDTCDQLDSLNLTLLATSVAMKSILDYKKENKKKSYYGSITTLKLLDK